MRTIEELRELSEHGELTEAIVVSEIGERRGVLSRLVGQVPYQMKLTSEIQEIQELPHT
jgi:hypothetical protein